MPVSFYALITPLSGGNRPGVGGGERPDNTLPQPQPPTGGGGGGERPDQGLPPFPSHPIIIPPDAIAPGVPTHPIYIPPIPDNSLPPFIQHPIVIPPDAIGPGVPTHPIYLPVYPDQGLPGQGSGGSGGQPPKPDNTLPGQRPKPDQGLPGQQPGIDNSLPPVELPPLPEIPDDVKALVLVKVPGQAAAWMVIDSNSDLKPPTHPTPKGGQQAKPAAKK